MTKQAEDNLRALIKAHEVNNDKLKLRLNECVEALEGLLEPFALQWERIDAKERAEEAVANARKPL